MKKKNNSSHRFLTLFLVLTMVISSFIPFVGNVKAEEPVDPSIYQATNIAFAPGADETKYNFSWYSQETPNPGVVEYAKKSDMTGEAFPSELAKTTTATVVNASSGYSTHKATISDVESESEYVYRLGDGSGKWSETYSFNTHETDSYNFLFMGDTQIGSDKVPSDTEGWVNTLNKAFTKYPNSSFILSAGDQVNNANSEEEYAGYFTPKELKQIPTATTIGNHDNSVSYKHHFNVPNETTYGATAAGGDYSFTRGDTLFIVLNSNNKNGEEHTAFMEETVAANPDAKWKFVVLHHSIYSAASHSLESSIVKLREDLVPTIDKLNIDAVLMGHDHSYVRTYQMKGLQPLKNQMIDEQGRVFNPSGTLYLTVNSSSGSKYYNLKETPEPYSAVRSQLRTPTFSNVTVTPTSVEFSTYRVDTMEQVDTYTIVKDPTIAVELPKLKNVSLEASGNQIPTNPSTFFEDVKLTLTGENVNGGPFDIPYSDITYKVKEEGQISISPSGEVTVLEGAKPGKIQVWAEVESEGKKFKTKKMQLTIVEHAEETIFEKGSSWKYLDNGSDQGTAWKAPDFDDSSWKSGLAPLGYPISEDRPMFGDIQTLIGYGPDATNKYPTTYFRTTFELEDLSKIGEMARINFGIDDSVILYLNGHEIGRHNLPEGDISYDKYLSDLAGSSAANEGAYESFKLTQEDLAHLVQGTNVLAAEVHQDRPTSSDVYWDMEFVTTVKNDAGDKKPEGKDKK